MSDLRPRDPMLPEYDGRAINIPAQNGGAFAEPLKSRGCRVLSLAAIAQIDMQEALDATVLNRELFELAKDDAEIWDRENAAAGGNEHRIIHRAFELLGESPKGRQVAVVHPDGSGWNAGIEHDYAIVEYPTGGTVGVHFVLCTAVKNVTAGVAQWGFKLLYDPWDGDDYIKGNASRVLCYRVS